MSLFDRGDRVRVLSSVEGGRPLSARVVLDVGGDTVIVNGSSDPAKMQRVERGRVEGKLAITPQPAPPRPMRPTATKPKAAPKANGTPRKVYCAESEAGLCALQRQASPPRAAEMAEGQWTLCGQWITGRSKPRKSEPACSTCRARIGLSDS